MEHKIIAAYAQVVVGVVQCGLIGVGLWLMSRSGDRRDLQLDVMTKSLERQSEALGKLLQPTP